MRKVAVVGGGIVGMAAAYQAACHGLEVTVHEAGLDGQATAAGAGIVAPSSFDSPELVPLVRAAAEFSGVLRERLAADGEPDTGYEVTGGLHVAFDDGELARLDQVLETAVSRQNDGFPGVGDAELVDGDAARRLFPALSLDVVAAVHVPGSGRMDGRRLRAALERAAVRRGGRTAPAATLERDGDAVVIRCGGVITRPDAVILAAGGWSGALAEAAGVELPLHRQRGQIVHLGLPGVATRAWPIILGFFSHYLITFPDNRVVAGATHEDEAGDDARVTAHGVREVLNDALRLAPGLADAVLLEARAGFRPCLPDDLPAIGAAPGTSNLFVATGHGSYGLQLGPHSGAVAADLAAGTAAPALIEPFDPGRFAGAGHGR